MGLVWLVRDLELDEDVAVKVLNPRLTGRPDLLELLKNECRNARRLVHPNIVRVFDFHRGEDVAFISMEYIDGADLATVRRRLGTLTHSDTIATLLPVVDALSYAHGQGLIHRDLKAGNVLIDRRDIPRLTDFGIAGLLQPDSETMSITSGGSLYSMSPQQLDGNKPHPTDDIYGLGVLMYELLTGHPPFFPDISPDRIRREIPLEVNQQLDDDSQVPGVLNELMVRLLAKSRDERPADLQEIRNEMQRLQATDLNQTIPPGVPVQAPLEARTWVKEVEIITPVKVPGEDADIDLSGLRRRNLRQAVSLLVVLGVLILGGSFLLYHLSKEQPRTDHVPPVSVQQEVKPSGAEPAEDSSGPDKTASPAKIALQKRDAEENLRIFVLEKRELDGKGGSFWGGQLYAEMTRLSQEADALFMAKEYRSASDNYQQATAKARHLEGQTNDALRSLIDDGSRALAEGDGERAQHAFAVALMIDPANELARRGLERSKKIDAVMRLLESGKDHEGKNRLSFAYADYQEALKLDPDSTKAQIGMNRVKGLIAGKEFHQLMSSGLEAYHKSDYELARKRLLKARSFRPDSPEVREALAQVEAAVLLERIEKLREDAVAAEQAENWDLALKSYLTVLDMDETIRFAAQGKDRSLKRIQLDKQIDFYLGKPKVLESDRYLKNAVLLLAEAKEIESKGPRLTSQIEKLDRLVIQAKTPVGITVESDNFTEVTIYKVGRLGRFEMRELSLRPGTYIVVGARDGYQDVRQKIVVKAGQEPLRITIKCRVKI
jgi:serine/threonine protein kinase